MQQTTLEGYRRQIQAVPELTAADLLAFKRGVRRVYTIMRTGRWCSREEICKAAEGSEGLRRMRELRAELRLRGYDIIRRKRLNSREFEYRICKLGVGA